MKWADIKLREVYRRHGAATGAGVAAVAVLAVVVILMVTGDGEPPRRVQELQIVNVVPPPPPPPPEPVRQEQQQSEMIEQPEITEPEVEPEEPTPEPEPDQPPEEVDTSSDEPPADLGLDAAGEGPGDAFNLVGRPGGSGLLGGGGGGGGGSRWGWYASMVQTQIEDVLREHEKTRKARLQAEIRLWSDAEGRITRVELVKSTGDRETDEILENAVLAGLTLREPPPRDMPMPIVTRITAKRPM